MAKKSKAKVEIKVDEKKGKKLSENKFLAKLQEKVEGKKVYVQKAKITMHPKLRKG
jgi:hypothetical protein